MKKLVLLFTLLSGIKTIYAQQMPGLGFPNRYYSIIQGGSNARLSHIELSSDVDTSWFRWKERGYSFGFNPGLTPMYTTVNGILSTPYIHDSDTG